MRAKIEKVRERTKQAATEIGGGRVVAMGLAKHAQRGVAHASGQARMRIKLPVALAERVAVASGQADFESAVAAYQDADVIEITRFPQLRLLCWNRGDTFLPAAEAFNLYERNWRFVDVDRMALTELALLSVLAVRFGKGVILA